MLFGNFNFATHGMFTIVFAIRMRITGLKKDLILLAFTTQTNSLLSFANPQCFAPIVDCLWQNRILIIKISLQVPCPPAIAKDFAKKT